MTPPATPHAWAMLIPAVVAGFFLPGYVITRRAGGSFPIVSSFIVSALGLFLAYFGLAVLGIRIEWSEVAGMVVVVVLGGLLFHFSPAKTDLNLTPKVFEVYAIDCLPLVVVFGAFVAKVLIDPLSGFDNGFRWDHIARILSRDGSLAFYPATTARDFRVYGWCDGIPPLVPILDAWLYMTCGSLAPVISAGRVLVEGALLVVSVRRLAQLLWNRGSESLALISACGLLFWSVAIGQETGLTALSLVAMFVYLEVYQRTERRVDLVLAAMAAALGALSREYGLAWPLLGLLFLAWNRFGWKDCIGFLFVAYALAAPWYLRNWALTGNPLYNFDIFGLFPVNLIQAETMRDMARHGNILVNPMRPSAWLPMIILGGGGGVIVAAIAWFRNRARILPYAVAVLVVFGLWAWSVGQTSAGVPYSLRVLSPALALCAAVGVGVMPESRRGLSGNLLKSAVLLGISIISACVIWNMPADGPAEMVANPVRHWRNEVLIRKFKSARSSWAGIAAVAGGASIVVDHPGVHEALRRVGAHPISWFSPEVRDLFVSHEDWKHTLASLRARNIRFVIISTGSVTRDMVEESPFLRRLVFDRPSNASIDACFIYDLQFLNAEPASAPSR